MWGREWDECERTGNWKKKYFSCWRYGSRQPDAVGYPEGALYGNSFKGMVHPEDLSLVESDISAQIKGENDIDCVKYRIVCKDGTEKSVLDYGRFVHTEMYGDVYYVFMNDITQEGWKKNNNDIGNIKAESHWIWELIWSGGSLFRLFLYAVYFKVNRSMFEVTLKFTLKWLWSNLEVTGVGGKRMYLEEIVEDVQLENDKHMTCSELFQNEEMNWFPVFLLPVM